MQSNPKHQYGGSPIVTLIILVIFGYGIFVGLQYAPQWIEARSVQSILDGMNQTQQSDPVNDAGKARGRVIKMLQVNEMNDMVDKFSVTRSNGRIVISFNYDRELNLLYEKRVIHYDQSTNL
jgi:hypothetical protein